MYASGADPGYQVRGAHLKKLRGAEGGANIFGAFRVKDHDFTPKNLIFPILGGARLVRPLDLPLCLCTELLFRKQPESKVYIFFL
jgi:hypothetical protein